jgi:hypothetical protein
MQIEGRPIDEREEEEVAGADGTFLARDAMWRRSQISRSPLGL